MSALPQLESVTEDPGALPEGGSPYEALLWALERFGADLRIACSLGVEDTVLVHEAARAGVATGVRPRVFLLDTGRLHPETIDFAERVRKRYPVDLEIFAPDAIPAEALVRRQGLLGFRASVDARHECCEVRKVLPLRRALAGARAWVTGLRREQAPTRAALRVVEVDEANGGLLKLSPLAAWTEEDVWAFAREHAVPTHPLHAQGYRSIGCAPCTRAVAPGEDVRAGRWWWESPEHKECGLHLRRSP